MGCKERLILSGDVIGEATRKAMDLFGGKRKSEEEKKRREAEEEQKRQETEERKRKEGIAHNRIDSLMPEIANKQVIHAVGCGRDIWVRVLNYFRIRDCAEEYKQADQPLGAWIACQPNLDSNGWWEIVESTGGKESGPEERTGSDRGD